MVFRRAFFCGKSPGEGAGKAGVSDTACRREHVRPRPKAAHGNDAACRRGAPVFLGGCCFCGRARRTGGAVQDGGASLSGGGFFLRGAGTDGESRTGRESGRPAGEADVPGGPGSREGEVGAFAADRCHRTEVRKRGVDAPGDSPEETARKCAGSGKSAGREVGRSSRPGQRQTRSRAGMRRRGACFPPQGVMVSAGGNVHPWGGAKEGRRGRETGLSPPSEYRQRQGRASDRDKGPGAAMGEERDKAHVPRRASRRRRRSVRSS